MRPPSCIRRKGIYLLAAATVCVALGQGNALAEKAKEIAVRVGKLTPELWLMSPRMA
jgi:hypothetical protein